MVVTANHVLVHPIYSLISTETASIHQEGVLKEVADKPFHIRKVLEVAKMMAPLRTYREVKAPLTPELSRHNAEKAVRPDLDHLTLPAGLPR